MSMQDPIADMLTRMRNALQRKKDRVSLPYSKFKENILKVFEEEGYIAGYTALKGGVGGGEDGQKSLEIVLKYDSSGAPAIRMIKRVSRPGLRRHVSVRSMPQIYGGLGTSVVTTSKGVMSARQALRNNLGGEVVCAIF